MKMSMLLILGMLLWQPVTLCAATEPKSVDEAEATADVKTTDPKESELKPAEDQPQDRKQEVDLNAMGKQQEELSYKYRDLLKVRRQEVKKAIKEREEALITEQDPIKRKSLVEELRKLSDEREDLSDKIRIINAGEVVKLSNTKDKVMAFLTGQN